MIQPGLPGLVNAAENPFLFVLKTLFCIDFFFHLIYFLLRTDTIKSIFYVESINNNPNKVVKFIQTDIFVLVASRS